MANRQSQSERQQERIKVLMEINKKLRIENIKLVAENRKLKHEKIIW